MVREGRRGGRREYPEGSVEKRFLDLYERAKKANTKEERAAVHNEFSELFFSGGLNSDKIKRLVPVHSSYRDPSMSSGRFNPALFFSRTFPPLTEAKGASVGDRVEVVKDNTVSVATPEKDEVNDVTEEVEVLDSGEEERPETEDRDIILDPLDQEPDEASEDFTPGSEDLDGAKAKVAEFDENKIEEVELPVAFVPTDKTILPSGEGSMQDGDREDLEQVFESVPRSKYVLEVLKELGIDLSENKYFTGKNDSSMVRKESYKIIVVPKLRKIILVCDEVGNRTFVVHDQGKIDRFFEMTKKDLKAKSPKGILQEGDVTNFVWTSDEKRWKFNLASHLLMKPEESDSPEEVDATKMVEKPEQIKPKMDKDYFLNPEIVGEDLERYLKMSGRGESIEDLVVGLRRADIKGEDLAVLTVAGESIKFAAYVHRAAVALGMTKDYKDAPNHEKDTLEVLKEIAGFEIKYYEPMDETYFNDLKIVREDLQKIVDAVNFGLGEDDKINATGLHAKNVRGIGPIEFSSGESITPLAYINRAVISLGFSKHHKDAAKHYSRGFNHLARVAGYEVDKYMDQEEEKEMWQDYFSQPENIVSDLDHFIIATGVDSVEDLHSQNMRENNVLCRVGKIVNGHTYLIRAGIALGLAENSTEANSKKRMIVDELKRIYRENKFN